MQAEGRFKQAWDLLTSALATNKGLLMALGWEGGGMGWEGRRYRMGGEEVWMGEEGGVGWEVWDGRGRTSGMGWERRSCGMGGRCGMGGVDGRGRRCGMGRGGVAWHGREEVWDGRGEIVLSDSLNSLTFKVCTRIGGSCRYQPSDEQSVWSIAGHLPGHSGNMVPRPF